MIRTDMKFDLRTLKHRLRRQEISQQEYDAHLTALPDESDNFVETEVTFTASFAERLKEGHRES